MDITQLLVSPRINVAKYNMLGNTLEWASVPLPGFGGSPAIKTNLHQPMRSPGRHYHRQLQNWSQVPWVIVNWHQHLITKIRSFETHAELSSLEDANPPGWSFAKEFEKHAELSFLQDPNPFRWSFAKEFAFAKVVAHRLNMKMNRPHLDLWLWYKIWITLTQLWDNFWTTLRSFEKQNSPLCKLQTHPDDLLQKNLPLPYIAHRLTRKWGVYNRPHLDLWLSYKIRITLTRLWVNSETTLGQLWDNFWTTLRQLLDNPETILGQTWDNFWTTLRQLWGKSETNLGQTWNNFWTTLRQFWEKSEKTLGQTWDNFWTTLRQLWENLRKLWDKLETIFGQLWDNFETTFGQLWDKFWTTLRQRWGM